MNIRASYSYYFKDEHRSLLLSFQIATAYLDIMAKIVFGFLGSKRWTEIGILVNFFYVVLLYPVGGRGLVYSITACHFSS